MRFFLIVGAITFASSMVWASGQVKITDRTPYLRNYPCSECHALLGDEEYGGTLPWSHPRPGTTHPEEVGCDTCHAKNDKDKLRLLSGKSISFAEVHTLCGQCHSDKAKDFSIGAHGKQVGSWNGLKHRYTCTDCHDAHTPKYRHTPTLAPPTFPEFGIRKGHHPH